MKITITLFLSILFFTSHSQESLVFENLNLNEDMRLIGMYPHFDAERTFEKYNFILSDLKILDSITKIIKKGKEVMNQHTRNEFSIRLFDRDKKLKTWSFNPKYSYIRTEGKSYEFEANQILNLARKFGFKYTFHKRTYKSKEQFDKDYDKLKSNPNLLFIYKPNFKFEGAFEVKFPKTSKFKHPKAISQYLKKKIEENWEPNQYRAYYIANKYNIKNPNQFTMTIESDFGLFEDFKEKNGEKGIWNDKEYSATIFIKN